MRFLMVLLLTCTAIGQEFKGHKIGETAQQFFAVATVKECKKDKINCDQQRNALAGESATIEGKYVKELGMAGEAKFREGKLAMLCLTLSPGTKFDDVITDVTKELGGIEPNTSTLQSQNAFGARLESRRAIWITEKLNVEATEARSFRTPDMGVILIIWDRDWLAEENAWRDKYRPSTIH